MPSLSRQLAQWVAGLRYEDLPPAVVDRAKGVTLHGLTSVLLGSQTDGGRQAVKLMKDEEAGVRSGATIMVDGTRVTRGGAAFANALWFTTLQERIPPESISRVSAYDWMGSLALLPLGYLAAGPLAGPGEGNTLGKSVLSGDQGKARRYPGRSPASAG